MRGRLTSILGLSILSLTTLACSDERDPSSPSSSGTGGDGGSGATDSGGSGGSGSANTGGTTSGGAGTGGSGSGGGPVDCNEGVPDGAPCAAEDEGDTCDGAGSACTATCTQGTWVEECVECPQTLPEDGSRCGAFAFVGPCDYAVTCPNGETVAVAECDVAQGVWLVTPADCTQP